MLDPDVRVATSTPVADPSGDYAFELFEKAEQIEPGSTRTLKDKALKLTGAPDSAAPPDDRSADAWHLDEDRAEIFLTYCTNAIAARKQVPEPEIVRIPERLTVSAEYGLIVLTDKPSAARFARYILAPAGQTGLDHYGFVAPNLS